MSRSRQVGHMRDASRLLFGFAASLLVAAGPVSAATGHVFDADGKPIAGARACLVAGGAEGLCSITDGNGYYGLPDSEVPWVRITASGFLPKQVAAVDHEAPITLDRSASLLVRLFDLESGAPISKGQVFVIYPSGAKKGPFPTNAAGVHVASLDPGEIVVKGVAEGHVEEKSAAQILRGGSELTVILKLAASSKTP